MAQIKAENLTFAYPGESENVFENVNFCIDSDWKLGLVGRNGRGKSTLLRLLSGDYEYGGKISGNVRFDYFPFDIGDKSLSAYEFFYDIRPECEIWELIRETSRLGIDEELLSRPFETLSGGERTKILLAALFLGENRFPLIDEPTNHLDANARKAVSEYLKRKKGFILVSHDRSFLDGCVNHIMSINRTGTDVRGGNFSSYLTDFEKKNEAEEAKSERIKKDISRMKKSAERAKEWSDSTEKTKNSEFDSGFAGHKAAKMMKRSKAVEARRERAIEEKAKLLKNREEAEKLKISVLTHYAANLVSFSGVSPIYDGAPVCESVDFTVRTGDRLSLRGVNGSGKSSLIKLLLGENIEHTGEIKTASGLIISYVPQDASFLRGTLSLFAEENRIDESLFKAILRKMGFEREQFIKDMQGFSEGQKKKALIAKSLCEKAHLYIWDEPCNYIDIYSRMQLEKIINEFEPTMIFVEHDASFEENAATKTAEIRRKTN